MRIQVPALFIISLVAMCMGCNPEREINLKLPKHTPQLVVESYLEPGKQVRLLLTESSPYLDPPSPPFVNDALVTVTYRNITDTLYLNTKVDEESEKIYNYISRRIVPEDYENEFKLYVKDSKGRELTGETKLVRRVPVDTLEYKYNKDSSALVLMSFYDDPLTEDYYRIIFHRDSLSKVVQRFEFTDKLSETSKISIGTPHIYKKDNVAFVTLYHIDKAYYEYLQSVQAARESNFNPFAQPAIIKSNVQGGIGVFTGLIYDQQVLQIE